MAGFGSTPTVNAVIATNFEEKSEPFPTKESVPNGYSEFETERLERLSVRLFTRRDS
jgi:hypothetical protein